jgi:hypothetical protein
MIPEVENTKRPKPSRGYNKETIDNKSLQGYPQLSPIPLVI